MGDGVEDGDIKRNPRPTSDMNKRTEHLRGSCKRRANRPRLGPRLSAAHPQAEADASQGEPARQRDWRAASVWEGRATGRSQPDHCRSAAVAAIGSCF